MDVTGGAGDHVVESRDKAACIREEYKVVCRTG